MDRWEVEIQFYVEQDHFPLEIARCVTIVRWMNNNDLRPLAAAIREGDVDPVVLIALAELIDEKRLEVIPLKRGSPKKPEQFARDLQVGQAYDTCSGNSDTRFRDIAKAFGLSEQTVRKAVTEWRKAKQSQQ